MRDLPLRARASLVLAGMLLATSAAAQTAAPARLIVTVVDPTGAVVPDVTVRVIGVDTASRAVTVPAGKTTATGTAMFETLVPGRYSVEAAAPGFDLGLLRNVPLRPGENRRVVVLPLRHQQETVSVTADAQEGASSRQRSTFGVALTAEEIALLSDDPSELAAQIAELAGSEAVIRVDSFEGQPLPPKAQIKSIHVTRDQYAAESAQPGTFVDIVTQPGIGPLAGGAGYSTRAGAFDGRSQFVDTRGPEQLRTYNANGGGTLAKNAADFSIAVNGRNTFTTPILNQTGAAASVLPIQQPSDNLNVSGLLNYTVTRDQVIRLGFTRNSGSTKNDGIGGFDSLEHGSSSTFSTTAVRFQQAGPIGRRTFLNTRVSYSDARNANQSNVEQPTVVILDGKTTGGAQVSGGRRDRTLQFAVDADHVRGIHSWRTGLLLYESWTDTDASSNYLGTYTFADQAAFDAGHPVLYTRTVGDPMVRYTQFNGAVYLQDDIRVSRSLTFSPGVRYTVESHVKDDKAVVPRFGFTWSPKADGRTTYRGSIGLFDYLDAPSGNIERTFLFDGQHQQQEIVRNPTYPEPGSVTAVPPTVYVLGPITLQKVLRYSVGVDRVVSPRLRVSALYAYYQQFGLWSFQNLNAPVNGVRPNPSLGNVVEGLTQAHARRDDVTLNATFSMLAPSPANNRVRFNWRRMAFSAAYVVVKDRNNAAGLGPYVPPASGTLATEWGRAPTNRPYRVNLSVVSTQLLNLNVNLTWVGVSGAPYSQLTGSDDNGDGFLNDRPSGVAKNTLTMSAQSTINLRAAYTMTTAASAGRRYRILVSVNASNLTNRANYGGYSGVMTSSFFERPAFVVNPRRVDVGVTLGF